MQIAICYSQAGRHSRALETYRDELTTYAFSHRDYGYYLSLQAGALATGGEPDEASAVGLEALTIAAKTDSTRTASELHHLAEQLQRWPNRPAVRDFRDALVTA